MNDYPPLAKVFIYILGFFIDDEIWPIFFILRYIVYAVIGLALVYWLLFGTGLVTYDKEVATSQEAYVFYANQTYK